MNEMSWMKLPVPISDPVIAYIGRYGMAALGVWIYASALVVRHNGYYREAELLSALAVNDTDVQVYRELKTAGVITVDPDGNIRTYTSDRCLVEMADFRKKERIRKSKGKDGKSWNPEEATVKIPEESLVKTRIPPEESISEDLLDNLLGDI